MFENILGQPAADLLIRDIAEQRLAPAMLFHGMAASGKGSAALELGRIISCGHDASWNCSCPDCTRHRFLLHPDMLCLGNRSFRAEIAAASDVFLRDRSNGNAKLFFIRSIRKLTARFNPVLWEDEPKFFKLSPLVFSLEERLDELDFTEDDFEKNVLAVIRDAAKLESEGMSETIPIAQIRRASWWSHLAPMGKGKILIIENADRMQEGARNSLLKLLEEPPPAVTLVLCSGKPNTLLPTILSRLRPYRFIARSEETEKEVLRRVFHRDNFTREESRAPGEKNRDNLITVYLESFLPVSGAALEALAAFFIASAAFKAALILKKTGVSSLPEELVLLGQFSAPLAEQAGLEKSRDSRETAARVLEGTGNFEIPALFSRFLSCLLSLTMESLRGSNSAVLIAYLELWRKYIEEAGTAVMVYNQSPGLALERLFICLSRGMAEL